MGIFEITKIFIQKASWTTCFPTFKAFGIIGEGFFPRDVNGMVELSLSKDPPQNASDWVRVQQGVSGKNKLRTSLC